MTDLICFSASAIKSPVIRTMHIVSFVGISSLVGKTHRFFIQLFCLLSWPIGLGSPLPGSGGSGFFCWGGVRGIKRGRRETTIAEGKKPLTTRGYGERRKLPQRDDFEHFKPKYSTFLDLVNLTFLNN